MIVFKIYVESVVAMLSCCSYVKHICLHRLHGMIMGHIMKCCNAQVLEFILVVKL